MQFRINVKVIHSPGGFRSASFNQDICIRGKMRQTSLKTSIKSYIHQLNKYFIQLKIIKSFPVISGKILYGITATQLLLKPLNLGLHSGL